MKNPVFDNVIKFYNEGASTYAKTWNKPHEWLEQERIFLKKKFANCTSILEVGCGPGHDTYFWNKQGKDVLGIDISPEMVNIAKENYPNINFKVANLFDIEEGRKFDVIWCSYSLLHIPVELFDKVLSKINALLKEQGFFFLTMSIAQETNQTKVPMADLFDTQENNLPVFIVRWNLRELKARLGHFFQERLSRISRPFSPESSYYSGLWEKCNSIEQQET